jgi:hypothetical protein
MRKTTLFLAVTAFTAAAASNISAQSTPDRHGFYADIGANYSAPSNELTDGTETIKDSKGGVGGVLGLGFGLKNNRWRLGLQVDYTKTSDVFENDIGPGLDATVTMYTAAVTFYPSATSNFWLRANLGYGMDDLSGSGVSASGNGFAGGLGLGFDWMLGKSQKLALAPYAQYMYFTTGDFDGDFSGSGVTGKVGMFQIGVTVGYKH